MKIYNTLTRKKETFKPINDKKVGMYVCGPTIYGPSHLGHARTYLAFDLIRKYLEYKGYQVKYIMNITDVHDDMIKQANKQGITIEQLADKYLPLFYQDMKKLGIKEADEYPRVSQHIDEIIEMIKKLFDKGFAYQKDSSVYFDLKKFKDYGKLSNIKLEKAKTGTRVETDKYTKENIVDFVLWKAAKENEPKWPSPWGQGRPGWHIECSVMSQKYLGEQFDIHGGARDLIFPHHENEIAQSEATTGKKPYVKYWLHSGLLKINGQKMSKSLNNFIELPDILKRHEPEVIRYFLIKNHYRSTVDYTEKGIAEAEKSLKKIWQFVGKLKEQKGKKKVKIDMERIEKELDDDFNTPKAFSVIFEIIRKTNKLVTENQLEKEQAEQILKTFSDFDKIFGIIKREKIAVPKEIKELVQQREKARKDKDWSKADRIREEIEKNGFSIEDTSQGSEIRKL